MVSLGQAKCVSTSTTLLQKEMYWNDRSEAGESVRLNYYHSVPQMAYTDVKVLSEVSMMMMMMMMIMLRKQTARAQWDPLIPKCVRVFKSTAL